MTISGSHYLNRQTAEQAVKLTMPMIEQAMKNPFIGESGFLYIVIMDPAMTPVQTDFEQAILYEHAVGDVARWDADYAGFARAKARVSWRTGLDSHTVQESRPYLLTAHDIVLWGSTLLDGITVSVSGANPWYDEAFAGCVAMCLRALAKANVEAMRGKQFFLQSL